MTKELTIDGVDYDLPPSTDFGEWASNTLAGPSWRHVIMRGTHTTVHGLDLTSCRQGVVVEAHALHLTGDGSSGLSAVLDITDSTGIRWTGGRIQGTYAPEVLLLTSRASKAGGPDDAAGKNRFTGVEFMGAASIASVLSIGAEQNHWQDCRIDNAIGPAVVLACNPTGWDPTSLNPNLTPGNDASAALCSFDHCQVNCTHADSDAVVIDGHDGVNLGRMYISSKRHCVVVDTTKEAITDPRGVLSCWPKSSGTGNAVHFKGKASDPIVGCMFEMEHAKGFANVFYVETPSLDLMRGYCADHEANTPSDFSNAVFSEKFIRRDRYGWAEWTGEAPT